MAKTKKDIGLDVKPPKDKCENAKCPWHGGLKIRGRMFKGEVVSAKTVNTAIVKWNYYYYIPKYERYERRKTTVTTFNPTCINAREGDTVIIGECRPLSKTKKFAVLEKV